MQALSLSGETEKEEKVGDKNDEIIKVLRL